MNLEVAKMVATIQSGDVDQMIELWEKFRPLWTKWSRTSGICGYEPEDLVQQSYMLLVEGLHKYKAELGVPFEGYYQYLLRGWAHGERRRKVNQPMTDLGVLEYSLMDERVDVMRDVEVHMQWEQVMDALGELSESEQQVMVGFYMKNCSLSVLAEQLGISYKGVEKKKAMTIRKLKARLGVGAGA